MNGELTKQDLLCLEDLLEIAIQDDVFDLCAYDSISRADKIDNAWKGLDVIRKILALKSVKIIKDK